MNQISRFFAAMPLPYCYITVPGPDEQRVSYPYKIYYYVEQNVITLLTRKSFFHCGLIMTSENNWIASWGKQFELEQYIRCQAYQKVNHFAGAILIGRKDELHKRMMEIRKNGYLVDFYPETFILKKDYASLMNVWHKHKVWILKPPALSRGRGIKLMISEHNNPPADDELIVQEYISRPLLITGRKFDIRIYLFIPSMAPLRIYIHKSGLAKFCTHKYQEDGAYEDVKGHLTNFSLNKSDRNFQRSNENESVSDSKWSLDFLFKYLENEYHCDTDKILKDIERICIAAVIAGSNAIRPFHQANVKHRHTCYEMYGIDILLDENLRAYLIEVNISPSMSGSDSALDQKLKYPLNLDLLRMARIIKCDTSNYLYKHPCPGIEIYDKHYFDSITPERRESVENKLVDPWENPVFADFVIIRDYVEEYNIKSGFRLIYPQPETMDQFSKCFVPKMCYEDIILSTWIKMESDKKLRLFKIKLNAYVSHINPIKEEIAQFQMEEKRRNNEEERLIREMVNKSNIENFEIYNSYYVHPEAKKVPRCQSVPPTFKPANLYDLFL